MQRGNISKGLERSEGESSSLSFYFKKSFFFSFEGSIADRDSPRWFGNGD